MMKPSLHTGSLLAAALSATLALGGCTRGETRQVVENEGAPARAYPQRVQLAGMPLAADAAPVQPEGAQWRSAPDGLHFGLAGQADLFAVACTHAADGTALLRVTRAARAEVGAKALFALIGNGRIARLPLDASRAGEAGEWQGLLPASDARLDVLRGGNRIEATLPGGGTLKLPASSELGRVLEACRANDRGPRGSAQAI